MELITGAIISLSASLLKKIGERLGQDVTRDLVLLFVFLCAFVVAYVYHTGIVSEEMVKTLGTIFLTAVGYYQIVTKLIVNKVIEKIKE